MQKIRILVRNDDNLTRTMVAYTSKMIYVASDGRQFDSEEVCKAYETSCSSDVLHYYKPSNLK